jgi:hypothetical protein
VTHLGFEFLHCWEVGSQLSLGDDGATNHAAAFNTTAVTVPTVK